MENNHCCKNCSAPLQGAYCHECGQKAATGRLTLRVVMHNLFYGLFHCDRNILYSYYALFTRPGKIMADYIDGRRIRYFNPFTMLVITAGIVGVLNEVLLAKHLPEALPVDVVASTVSRLWHHLQTLLSSNVTSAILLTPLFTLATKWAVGKKSGNPYNYTELLVAGVYVACQWLVLYTLIVIPVRFIFGDIGTADALLLLPYLAFLVWDFRQLFRFSIKKSIGRTLLMTLYFLLITLLLTVLLILLILGVMMLFDPIL
jgi:hypothetical protein